MRHRLLGRGGSHASLGVWVAGVAPWPELGRRGGALWLLPSPRLVAHCGQETTLGLRRCEALCLQEGQWW